MNPQNLSIVICTYLHRLRCFTCQDMPSWPGGRGGGGGGGGVGGGARIPIACAQWQHTNVTEYLVPVITSNYYERIRPVPHRCVPLSRRRSSLQIRLPSDAWTEYSWPFSSKDLQRVSQALLDLFADHVLQLDQSWPAKIFSEIVPCLKSLHFRDLRCKGGIRQDQFPWIPWSLKKSSLRAILRLSQLEQP